jgi:Ca2+-dependent lipid-binding protein
MMTGPVTVTGMRTAVCPHAPRRLKTTASLEIMVADSLNLAIEETRLASCGTYVILKTKEEEIKLRTDGDGVEFEMGSVKESMQPVFHGSFCLNLKDKVTDPLCLYVMKWNSLSKDQMIGSCILSSDMLQAMCTATSYGPIFNLQNLELSNEGQPVYGCNDERTAIQIRWRRLCKFLCVFNSARRNERWSGRRVCSSAHATTTDCQSEKR